MKKRFWIGYVILMVASVCLGQEASGAPKAPPIVLDIDEQFLMLGHAKAISDINKQIAELNQKIQADCKTAKPDTNVCKIIALEDSREAAATAEMADADKLINKHKWKATFNFQAQRFEAKP